MNDTKKWPFIEWNSYYASKVLGMALSQPARAIKRINPEGEFFLCNLVLEALTYSLQAALNVWCIPEFFVQLNELI